MITPKSTVYQWDWEFEVGAFERKPFMFALRSIASKLGLTFKVLADDGGWISTTYLVRVEGSKEAIDDYRRVLRRMAKDLE
jgi:hypothetical protein